jgi:HlyD family secretion protein
MRKLIVLTLVLATLGGAGYWHWHAQASSPVVFRCDEVKRGRLVATVSSTGTLQPREVVDVGAQVLGRIISIGKDAHTQSGIVDWGSVVEGPVLKDGAIVKQGTVLAQIDPDLYTAAVESAQAAVESAEAQLQAAQAQLQSAQADLRVKSATLEQATADWARAQRLIKIGGVAQAEYDQFHATFDVATANVAVSQANILQAKASIATARGNISTQKANLKTAQVNLNYTTITAPVNGVVIDRRVNVGQTVVASLSAPSLFLIAKDLTRMEVWATVNEVDVGKIQAGQDVDFTVDALPGHIYHGKVVPQGKLPFRLNATMTQNVVTYTVVVSAPNDDLMLRPYWTTNLSFIVGNKQNALLVPNAALRWQPAPKQIVPEQREAYAKLKSKKRAPTDTDGQDRGFIWVQADNGMVKYFEVRTGLSDSVHTEVVSLADGSELPEHTQVIVGEGKSETRHDGSNPFSVKMFQSKPKE